MRVIWGEEPLPSHMVDCIGGKRPLPSHMVDCIIQFPVGRGMGLFLASRGSEGSSEFLVL